MVQRLNSSKQGTELSRELLVECDRSSWQWRVSVTFYRSFSWLFLSLVSRIHPQVVYGW